MSTFRSTGMSGDVRVWWEKNLILVCMCTVGVARGLHMPALSIAMPAATKVRGKSWERQRLLLIVCIFGTASTRAPHCALFPLCCFCTFRYSANAVIDRARLVPRCCIDLNLDRFIFPAVPPELISSYIDPLFTGSPVLCYSTRSSSTSSLLAGSRKLPRLLMTIDDTLFSQVNTKQKLSIVSSA